MDGAPRITGFDDLDGLVAALRDVVERLFAIDEAPATEFWSDPATGGAAPLSSGELRVIWPATDPAPSTPTVRTTDSSTVHDTRRPVA
jgi:hypothetical protein